MEQEVLVGTSYSDNEMIFESTNGLFCWVYAVDVGRDYLKFLIYLPHESFEHIGTFILQDV